MAQLAQADDQQREEQDGVDREHTVSRPSTDVDLRAHATSTLPARPRPGRRTGALTRQHRVDEQLDQGEHRPEHREQPQPVGDLGVVVATHEHQREPRAGRRRRGRRARPEAHDEREATEQGAPALVGGRHRGEGDHDHELGEEEHRLGEDQAAGVETGLVPVEDVARDDDVAVASGPGTRAGSGSCRGSRGRIGRRAVVLARRRPARGPPRRSTRAHRHRHDAARSTPIIAVSSVGRHRISAAAEHQPRHAAGDVQHRDRPPAALALEDPELAAHDASAGRPSRRASTAAPRLSRLEQPVDDRREHQEQRRPDDGGGPIGQAEDLPLDLGDVRRGRRRSGGPRWPGCRAGRPRRRAARPSARRRRRTPGGRAGGPRAR